MSTKDTVRDLLDRLPDDCTRDDVLYHLYVIQAAERGIADAGAGRIVSHRELAATLGRKWALGGLADD